MYDWSWCDKCSESNSNYSTCCSKGKLGRLKCVTCNFGSQSLVRRSSEEYQQQLQYFSLQELAVLSWSVIHSWLYDQGARQEYNPIQRCKERLDMHTTSELFGVEGKKWRDYLRHIECRPEVGTMPKIESSLRHGVRFWGKKRCFLGIEGWGKEILAVGGGCQRAESSILTARLIKNPHDLLGRFLSPVAGLARVCWPWRCCRSWELGLEFSCTGCRLSRRLYTKICINLDRLLMAINHA